jgi:threonylcarbamoyladenosine tRNA methylthiotransferase MtaB
VTRVYIHTFGCKANQYDSEVLRQALEATGATMVHDPASADAAIVNSCTVTHVSEAKMRGLVRRISRKNPGLKSISIVGCAATLDEGDLATLPGVTSVIGGTDPDVILHALGLSTKSGDRILRSFRRGARAWLKIQDGCDENCTYCATRVARGASISRPPKEILREAETLAGSHAELVLTGVHIGCYGDDLEDRPSLSNLVSDLIGMIPDVRFRLSSVEATQLDDTLMELMAGASDRVAPHVHAPLQSGSDRLLRLMGRTWYTASEYRRRLENLAKRVSALGLGADIIVGFPGETDDDFAATRSLVEELPFTYLHVFPYSPRPVAPSVKLGPPTHPDVVKSRSAELRDLADARLSEYKTTRDGTEGDVVLIRRSSGRYEGLTEDYLTVFTPIDTVVPARFRAMLRNRNGTVWAEPAIS